jgi:AcrR family transcriptional regulator
MESVASPLTQMLRSDARDNRDRILGAARSVFVSQGFDAPMRSVADRAGVAPATLYRRFPTKQALITEAFAEQMDACHAVIEKGLADPDPWRGLSRVIEDLFALHARDWGFARAFAAAFPRAADLGTARERSLAALALLTRRARATGRLRPDFSLDDLIVVLRANNGLRGADSRRFARLAIRALAA